MNPFAPHPRNPNRLNVEWLEDRCPASTTLDVLLHDMWLSSIAGTHLPAQRAGFSGHDLAAAKARPSGLIDNLSESELLRVPQRVEVTRPARQTHPEPGLNVSLGSPGGIDLGFDLPFRGVPVSVAPAARDATGARSIAVGGVESPTTGTPGALIAPAAAAAAVATEDDSEATFVVASSLLADPTISLTRSTTFIPVNANRTSQSPWQRDAANNALTGLPVVRDFDLNPMRDLSGWNGLNLPPEGPAIADPELKQVTATVTLNGHTPQGPMVVSVIYSDADNGGGGLIWLWRDQTKENSIPLTYAGNGVYSGTLPDYPTSTFYVEGIRPSKQANDVRLKVGASFAQGPGGQPPPVQAETTLTVTPVVAEFSVTPKQGGQVTFLKNLQGQIVGLNSGTQSADGGPVDSGATDPNNVGAIFTANVDPRTGIAGDAQFLQTITVTNGDPSGVSLSGLGDRNMRRSDGQPFPILDSVRGFEPFYPVFSRAPNTTDRVQLTAFDTPYVAERVDFNNSTWANLITRMDVTYAFRLHLVWHYPDPDGTIFSLAKVDWWVVFRTADLDPIIVSPDSIITADPFQRYYADPARVIRPIFNETFEWVAPG